MPEALAVRAAQAAELGRVVGDQRGEQRGVAQVTVSVWAAVKATEIRAYRD